MTQILDYELGRLNHGWPKVRFGLVLCGQKLADNPWGTPVRVAWPAQVAEQMLWQLKFATKGELCVSSFMLARAGKSVRLAVV